MIILSKTVTVFATYIEILSKEQRINVSLMQQVFWNGLESAFRVREFGNYFMSASMVQCKQKRTSKNIFAK